MARYAGVFSFTILTVVVLAVLAVSRHTKEEAVKRSLREISHSCEWYYKKKGVYPPSETALLALAPPYLNSGFCDLTLDGYKYSCSFAPSGYIVKAGPYQVSSKGGLTVGW
jgi:hypothetical protein